jgi:alkaline phosphatase
MKYNPYFLFLFLITFCFPSFAQTNSPRVHSHNDYEQERPFWEAYEAECGSIEVDIFLQNDSIFVAHELETIDKKRTLNSLYLKPITKVLAGAQTRPFQLLIDIKTEAKPTLERLIIELKQYPVLLTQNKVKFVISGNCPAPQHYGNYPLYIFFDHQSIEDLDEIDLKKVALVSLPFYKTVFWNGKEELPTVAKQKVKAILEIVHAQGLPFRFWATPDTELSWKTMSELSVDFINTDKPKACSNFLKNR